jgi:hypothetical protein
VLRILPPPWLIGLAALGAVAVFITLAKGLADPDYFWHLTTGRLILSDGAIPSTDPYSFTWFGRPWTDHEWLGQVTIAILVDGPGVAVAAIVLALAAFGGLAVMSAAIRPLVPSTIAIVGATAVSALTLVPWLTIRPQALSWLLLAILLALLIRLQSDAPRRALWTVPLFALWANVHGLWVIGVGVAGIYLIATLIGGTGMRHAKGWALIAALGSIVSLTLTPAGPAGVLYPLRYVEIGDWGRARIAEWQSPDFHDPANLPFLGLIALLLLLRFRGTSRWLTAVALLGVVLGLVSVRNVPVAAVLAFPSLAMSANAWLATKSQPVATMQASRRVAEMGLAAVVIAVAALTILPNGRIDLVAQAPVAGMDRLVEIDPDARLFAEYEWGGYAISRLYDTGGRVFVDGRNDMYSDDILRSYETARDATAGWEETLKDATAILLPPEAKLVSGPAQAVGWCEAYRDGVQVLLVRSCPRAL